MDGADLLDGGVFDPIGRLDIEVGIQRDAQALVDLGVRSHMHDPVGNRPFLDPLLLSQYVAGEILGTLGVRVAEEQVFPRQIVDIKGSHIATIAGTLGGFKNLT